MYCICIVGKQVVSENEKRTNKKRLNTSPLAGAIPKAPNQQKTPNSTHSRSAMEKYNLSPLNDGDDFVDEDDVKLKGEKSKKKKNKK